MSKGPDVSMVTGQQVSRDLRLRLAEEIERQERDDDADDLEVEPDAVVTRTLLPSRAEVEVFVREGRCPLGGDELRVRAWLRARLAGGC